MAAIILASLQILLLLLKAHYTRNDDQEKSLELLQVAQAKLDSLAEVVEQKIRYSSPKEALVDTLQDSLDSDRKQNE